MTRALRGAAAVLAWIVLWGGIGWVVGYRDHGHVWQLIPLLGAAYGLAAGTLSAVLHASPLGRGHQRLTRAIALGALGSLASLPAICLLIGGFVPLLLAILPIAGAVTGAATAWIFSSDSSSTAELPLVR